MIARAGWLEAGEEVRDERSTHGVIGRHQSWPWLAFVLRLLVHRAAAAAWLCLTESPEPKTGSYRVPEEMFGRPGEWAKVGVRLVISCFWDYGAILEVHCVSCGAIPAVDVAYNVSNCHDSGREIEFVW